ncbi:hypothetical protein [Lederbergia citrea]|uniref:Uncharacterized protein n=1 Tax=Lederbergia citrea TaxID=2833581 RepID=A0A942Z2W3_9BACI|nr:hypothetical protein [Lederbergia citrea]MBS4221894.1 hypothetical protein [Lederbergia citrea]
MCDFIGIGIGLFFVSIGRLFLYLNTKGEQKALKLFSLFSFESGVILLGFLIILISSLSLLGIGTGTCKSIFD